MRCRLLPSLEVEEAGVGRAGAVAVVRRELVRVRDSTRGGGGGVSGGEPARMVQRARREGEESLPPLYDLSSGESTR